MGNKVINMFGKKKKGSLLKKLGFASAVTTYIGSEINTAMKRYEIKESKFVSDTLVLEKTKNPSKDCYTPTQRYYEFDILNKETREVLGTCQLLMGQEEDSFYGGHIRVKADKLSQAQKREIDVALAQVAKSHLMTHVNFVCARGDKNAQKYFESLGAKFVKLVKVPQDSPYFVKKHRVIEQYRLDTVDEKVIQYMELTAKRKAEKIKKNS